MTIFLKKGYFSKTIKAIFPKLGRGHSWLKGFKFAQISQLRDYEYLIFFPLIFVVVSSYLSSSLLLLGLRWMIRVMGQLRLTIVIWHCYLVHRYNRKKQCIIFLLCIGWPSSLMSSIKIYYSGIWYLEYYPRLLPP